MQTFRGGTAAELIPFRLDDGEDLVPTLARTAEELNLGSAALVMGSGTLSIARLAAAGAAGPGLPGIIAERRGPLPIVAMQGWILADQPEVQLILAQGAGLIAGRAMPGCLIERGGEGLLLRLGNLRLGRLTHPESGEASLASSAALPEMPRVTLQGHAVDPRALLKVPPQLMQRHRLLPVALTGDTLVVATADPHNLFALSDLRQATGLRIQWLETPADALDAAIDEVLRWTQGPSGP